MGMTYVSEWFSQVKSGLTSADLGHSSMSQTSENMDSVRKLIQKSKIMTIYVKLLICWKFYLSEFRGF
jgi:hypothetical protein